MSEPVTPDREALMRTVWLALNGNPITGWDQARCAVDALLPPLADALDRARQQGKRDGREELSEEVVNWLAIGGWALVEANLGHLARGADRKAADAPWDTALDVDPFTGQPDQHEHGDSCEGGCE